MSKPFEELEIWRRAVDLAISVRKLTKYPALKDDPDLRSQMRRAAVSIPSNIAEGYERASAKDSFRFYSIAKASAGELRTQIIIAERGGDISHHEAAILRDECIQVSRMLMGFMKAIRGRIGDD